MPTDIDVLCEVDQLLIGKGVSDAILVHLALGFQTYSRETICRALAGLRTVILFCADLALCVRVSD